MGGVFYGNPTSGEGTGNGSLFLSQASRRFRAERSGQIDAVRHNNRTLSAATIADRCNATPGSVWCECVDGGLDEYTCGYHLSNSYHVGNGGSVSIEIQSDDGTTEHLPSGVVLGRTVSPYVPVDIADQHYPIFDLEAPAELQGGCIYHVVYRQLNPPTACTSWNQPAVDAANCDQDKGAIGLNGIQFTAESPDSPRFGPWHGDAAAILTQQEADGAWHLDPNNLSWFEVRYTDGTWMGDGVAQYRGESDGGGAQIFGAGEQVRQRFNVRVADREVDGIWLYARRLSATAGAISATLAADDETPLATAALTAAEFELCAPACSRWAYAELSESVTLDQDQAYSLTLETTEPNSYLVSSGFPLDYSPYSSTCQSPWHDAQAEYSDDGGSSWSGFAADYHPSRDISLLFTIVGMPRALP